MIKMSIQTWIFFSFFFFNDAEPELKFFTLEGKNNNNNNNIQVINNCTIIVTIFNT